MCVPVCDPSESTDTLAASPRSMSSIRSIRTGGLSGQWTIPSCSGTETSIHPSSLGVRDPLSHTGYPPFRFRLSAVRSYTLRALQETWSSTLMHIHYGHPTRLRPQ